MLRRGCEVGTDVKAQVLRDKDEVGRKGCGRRMAATALISTVFTPNFH